MIRGTNTLPPYRLEETLGVLANRGPELGVQAATAFSSRCCKLHGIADDGADPFNVLSYVRHSYGILATVEAQHYSLEYFLSSLGLPCWKVPFWVSSEEAVSRGTRKVYSSWVNMGKTSWHSIFNHSEIHITPSCLVFVWFPKFLLHHSENHGASLSKLETAAVDQLQIADHDCSLAPWSRRIDRLQLDSIRGRMRRHNLR